MTPKEHNRLLSIFFFVFAGIQIFSGFLLLTIYGIFGTAMLTAGRGGEEQMIGGVIIGVSVFVALFVALFAGIYFFTGLKMRREEKIGRTLGIVASILSLMSFPLGTALGVYGLWFLFGEAGKNFYSESEFATRRAAPPAEGWK